MRSVESAAWLNICSGPEPGRTAEATWLAAEYGATTIRRGQLEFYWDPPRPPVYIGGRVIAYEDADASDTEVLRDGFDALA